MAGNNIDKDMCVDRALKAADWFVNSQLGGERPDWEANTGRFLYYYYMPKGTYVPGINWTTGRALFVLSEAYKISGDERYLKSAQAGADYIAALQEMDPWYGKAVGAIREMTPQLKWAGMLDGAQAASGLMMLDAATGKDSHFRRAQAYCDFLVSNFTEEKGLPWRAILDPEVSIEYNEEDITMAQCTAIPLWHIYKKTGDKKYLPGLIWAADFCLDTQNDDGSFMYRKNPESAPPPPANHHEGRGESDVEKYKLRNDDGVVVVLLAAHMATDDARYLDACLKYAEWIQANAPQERPYCAFPIQANNLMDIGRVAGRDYTDWIEPNLEKHLLSLQVLDSDDKMANGGFRGEDEEDEGGIFGGTSLEYVTTRVTCYATGTLLRLCGKGTGAGFSPFGIE